MLLAVAASSDSQSRALSSHALQPTLAAVARTVEERILVDSVLHGHLTHGIIALTQAAVAALEACAANNGDDGYSYQVSHSLAKMWLVGVPPHVPHRTPPPAAATALAWARRAVAESGGSRPGVLKTAADAASRAGQARVAVAFRERLVELALGLDPGEWDASVWAARTARNASELRVVMQRRSAGAQQAAVGAGSGSERGRAPLSSPTTPSDAEVSSLIGDLYYECVVPVPTARTSPHHDA
jgi:hypothetical protein